MDKYKRKPVVVDAIQFDPQQKPWPDVVHPWPTPEGVQPRDMSCGYISYVKDVWLHVMAGDWLIYEQEDGKTYWSELLSDKDFRENYEAVTRGGLAII